MSRSPSPLGPADHQPVAAPDGALAADRGERGTPGLSSEQVRFTVNGRRHELSLDPRTALLDALRELLDLTGTKKGCDHGQCGACTVLVNGRRINACLSLAVMHEGDEIVTVEGLEALDEGRRSRAPRGPALGEVPALHPLQAAFVEEDAFQCGYCTPGQLCSGVALLAEIAAGEVSLATWEAADAAGETVPGVPGLDEEEIRERMSGNLCRCGAYPNIIAALRRTAGGGAGPGEAR